MELLRNVWLGWQQFTASGKLVVFLPAALLFLWLGGKWKEKRSYRALFGYTSVMALCCTLPITAAALMIYQNRFYDYQWVWSLVPLTAVAAWAGTELLDQCSKGFQMKQWRKWLPVSLLLLATLALCSGLGKGGFDRPGEEQRRLQAQQVLAQAAEQVAGRQDGTLLWAPRDILEYAREFDGSLELIYGRNMWDAALGAYSYDAYSLEIQNLYLWIENVDETGLAVVNDPVRGDVILQGKDCVISARNLGVDYILLPSRIEFKDAEALAQLMGGNVVLRGDYYLLKGEG